MPGSIKQGPPYAKHPGAQTIEIWGYNHHASSRFDHTPTSAEERDWIVNVLYDVTGDHSIEGLGGQVRRGKIAYDDWDAEGLAGFTRCCGIRVNPQNLPPSLLHHP